MTPGPLHLPDPCFFWTFPFSPAAKALSELKDLNYSDRFHEIFLPDGQPLLPGMFVRRPDLAAVLQLLGAEGVSAFYSGNLTQEMISEVSQDCPWVGLPPAGLGLPPAQGDKLEISQVPAQWWGQMPPFPFLSLQWCK